MKQYVLLILASSVTLYAIIADKNVNQEYFQIMELHFLNKTDVQDVCNLWADKETQKETGITDYDQKIFFDLAIPGKKYADWKTYIAKNSENKICGVVTYIIEDNVAWIRQLLVHRNYRKKGIATKLVQSILNNHTIKQLTTYFRENFEQQTHVAINFFKKNGFVEFERSKGLSKNLESLSIGSQLLEIPVNFEIKNVNIEDAQEVQGACDLFADKEIQDMTHDTPEFMKNQSPYWNNQTFIAKTCEGKVCGFINSDMDGDFPINSSKTIITSLAIHKDYRNCGLATLLMQNIESLSLAQKIKKLELWLIADNEKALKCYKKFGFIEFSTSIGMRKTL